MDRETLHALADLMIAEADMVLTAIQKARDPLAVIFSGVDEARIHKLVWEARKRFWETAKETSR